jgi:hypothetical protein
MYWVVHAQRRHTNADFYAYLGCSDPPWPVCNITTCMPVFVPVGSLTILLHMHKACMHRKLLCECTRTCSRSRSRYVHNINKCLHTHVHARHVLHQNAVVDYCKREKHWLEGGASEMCKKWNFSVESETEDDRKHRSAQICIWTWDVLQMQIIQINGLTGSHFIKSLHKCVCVCVCVCVHSDTCILVCIYKHTYIRWHKFAKRNKLTHTRTF